ncbi:MAG: TrkH family potassium uptake protein [Oscillospiraceae bacterium]|jgi:trk system potassium uptake protein TrkH|nr:TrkH family potassium uptake protein [Oscillospiraceae bacterium]
MNIRLILGYMGRILLLEGLLMIAPLLLAIYDGDAAAWRAFLKTVAVLLLAGFALNGFKLRRNRIHNRDSFVVVAACWIIMSFFGAFPLWFSGAAPSFIDALFESVSGFTTTAASTFADVEVLPRGVQLWMAITNWVGGMGVLLLLSAVAPMLSDGNESGVMRAETPGPEPGKLVPKLRQSAGIIYAIYFTLSVLQLILYLVCGIPLFDSIINVFAVAGTGGFSVKNASLAAYGNFPAEIVAVIFMILYSTNFNVYYFIITRNGKALRKNEEVWCYFGVMAFSVAVITVDLTRHLLPLREAFRSAVFQVPSIMSSTGFATDNIGAWPQLSKAVLFALMFVGSCAGSTGGGIKMSRIIIILREAKRQLHRFVHPRAVENVRLGGRAVDKKVLHRVNTYVLTFIVLYGMSVLLVAMDHYDFETTVSAVAACINNVGVGYGHISVAGRYADFSPFSKIVLMMDMLLGRLEIYPILLLFAPRTWKRLG